MALGTRFLDAAGTILAKIHQPLNVSGTDGGILHVAQYPAMISASEGAYRAALVSGTMVAGLAATSEVFQFRWTSATLNCAVRSVKLSASVAGTAFAAGVPFFRMTMARSWSADGSGGTAATLTTNNAKNRTDFATPALGAMRISATAALTAGTKTLDATDCAAIVGVSGTATTGQIVPAGTDLYNRYASDEYPVLLEQNEGFVIRATVPATGTWSLAVSVEWSEFLLASY
jgi:hypothetical protein